jgi:hypothetical protein
MIVKDFPDFETDGSGIFVNTSVSKYNEYMKEKEKNQRLENRLKNLEADVDVIKSNLYEILNILKR